MISAVPVQTAPEILRKFERKIYLEFFLWKNDHRFRYFSAAICTG
jgi:hypothetical protein